VFSLEYEFLHEFNTTWQASFEFFSLLAG